MQMHDLEYTIVAIATPPGRGGVGCVRLSGPEAHAIAQQMFRGAAASKSSSAPKDHTALAASLNGHSKRDPKDKPPLSPPSFGRFISHEGEAMDHGYLLLFPEGRSFTGEPTAELWPHGSPAVMEQLLRTAIRLGAVAAGPGEFSYRALRSGRLDLTRAEAIRDLIDARSAFQAKVAFNQVEGALAKRITPLREQLADCIANAEAAVEFVEESDVHLPEGTMLRSAKSVLAECDALREGFQFGKWVGEGAKIALVGMPNVGKSSCFNAWLQEERAIVTEVPGTTRDLLEATATLDGIPLSFVDTAGVRQTEERIEREGIRRAERARDEADRVILLLDGSVDTLDESEVELLKSLGNPTEHTRTIVVWNKFDLVADDDTHRVRRNQQLTEHTKLEPIWISALTGDGFDALRDALRDSLFAGAATESPLVTHTRHDEALRLAREALARAVQSSEQGLTEEWVLEDLREAMDRLGEITGAFTNEDLYDRVFTTFCIGK